MCKTLGTDHVQLFRLLQLINSALADLFFTRDIGGFLFQPRRVT
jgi:hypothetical protein